MNRIFNLSSVFLFILIMFSCCRREAVREVTDSYADGNPKKVQYFLKEHGKRKVVKEEEYYSVGQMKLTGGYDNKNRKTGKWVYWRTDGKIWSEGYFKDGVRTGETKVYYENGNLFYSGTYKQGKRHDRWTFYNEKGSKQKEYVFYEGKMIREEDFSVKGPLK